MMHPNLHSAAITLNYVGQTTWASVLAGIEALLQDNPELLTATQTHGLLKNLDYVVQKSIDILQDARVAALADSVSFMWAKLPKVWEQREARLNLLWDPFMAQATQYLFAFGGKPAEPPHAFVNVNMDPADEDYVARVHYLSGLEPALRIMFIEASDPDTLYTAEVLDEDAVSSILASYPVTHWKSPATVDTVGIGEFWVYVVRGKRIFRTDGLVASTDLDALRVLQSGEFLPRMASLRTASVIRMTFSLQAMLDPSFRDFLRDLGGVPASVVSWDVPIYEEKDVDGALDKVRENFGYPVHFYQIIDTPEQNIYASTNPEGQVARMLSAEIEAAESGSVEVPDLSDVYEKVAACLPNLSGQELHTMERVASACKVSRHYFVARVGEVKPQSNRFACDLGKLFTNPRTENGAQKVRVYSSAGVTQIVATGALALDKNNDGTIDATEMGTLGLMSGTESSEDVLDDSCAYGHCPECSAEGAYEDGKCIVCVDGHKCAADMWGACDCGPLPEEKTATASVAMPTKDRDVINHDLRQHGMNGQFRFPKVGAALAQAASILNKYGYEIDDALTGHLFNRPEGTYSLDVAKSGEDPFSPVPVTNTGLFVQWNPYGDTQDTSVIMYLG